MMLTLGWVCIAGLVIFLLVAAGRHREERHCAGVEVVIHGVSNNFFIDEKDVVDVVNKFNGPKAKGKTANSFDLRKIENALGKEMWIQGAELYFDDNDMLQVRIEEREPVARLFSVNGQSFYIDSSAKILPLSNKLSARVPVFTGFPAGEKGLTKADSNLLRTIVTLSQYIQQDEFLQAMIDQTDITAQRKFELIPKLGRQIIHFGEGIFIEEKFRNLKAFYKNIMLKAGWSKYSMLDLQYQNQVVARLRGKTEIAEDSVRTLQLMELIAQKAQMQAADSASLFSQEHDTPADSSLLRQSVEREDNPDGSDEVEENYTSPKPATEAPAAKLAPTKPVVIMPAKKPASNGATVNKPSVSANKPQITPAKKPPKFVMPKKE